MQAFKVLLPKLLLVLLVIQGLPGTGHDISPILCHGTCVRMWRSTVNANIL